MRSQQGDAAGMPAWPPRVASLSQKLRRRGLMEEQEEEEEEEEVEEAEEDAQKAEPSPRG